MTSAKGGRFFYRSSWEKTLAKCMDRDVSVLGFRHEPFGIPYRFKGVARTYYPDFLVGFADGTCMLVEVKGYAWLGKAEERAKIKAAEAYCAPYGITFSVVRVDPRVVDFAWKAEVAA
jgi:hypothetical protein